VQIVGELMGDRRDFGTTDALVGCKLD